jgi:hypothetical protein
MPTAWAKNRDAIVEQAAGAGLVLLDDAMQAFEEEETQIHF